MPDSAIALIGPRTGRPYSAAGESSVVLSSAQAGWRSPLVFEVHRMADASYAEHRLVDHRLFAPCSR